MFARKSNQLLAAPVFIKSPFLRNTANYFLKFKFQKYEIGPRIKKSNINLHSIMLRHKKSFLNSENNIKKNKKKQNEKKPRKK